MPAPVAQLVAGESYIYAIAEANAAIYRLPKCGGRTEVVARSTIPISGLTLTHDSVYWFATDYYASTFFRTPVGAASSETIFPLEGESAAAGVGIASDGEAVFFSHSSPPGLLRVEASGERTLLQDYGAGFPLLVDETDVYFQSAYGQTIYRIAKHGGETAEPIAEIDQRLLAADQRALYYTDYGELQSELYRLPKAGGDAAKIYEFNAANTVVSDGACVYANVTLTSDGGLENTTVRLATTGGDVEQLLPHREDSASALAVDSDSVYLGTSLGSIMRRPK